MKIYVVMDIDDIYGIFSTLEKAKKHVLKMIDKDVDMGIDKTLVNYSINSFVLDKSELNWPENIDKLELQVEECEVTYDVSKGDTGR